VGQVLAINGDTAVIGEPDQDFSANLQQGAAYVFVRTRTASGDSWMQQTEFADLGGSSYDNFGSAVAIDGNTIAIGSQRNNGKEGVAYVYVRSGTTWSLQSKFSPAEKEANDYFGNAVALRGNRLLVGAPGANHRVGAAYVLERTGSSWTEKKRITASDAAAVDVFGAAVALSVTGDVAVAASNKSIGPDIALGRVYVFSGAAWANEAQIDSARPDNYDYFGRSLAMDGNRLAIGEPGSKSAYLYLRNGSTWELQSIVTGDDYSEFGLSVALSGSTVVVGAPFERSPLQSGRAFFLQDDRIFADGYQ
jgi:drug/metabolite transporter superfamily protein YnfA